MANVCPTDKKIAIISPLCEDSSIRSIERITGVHRDTIMRLGVRVGQCCTALMDAKMRNLDCNRLALDEIWRYVGKKEKHLRAGDELVPTFKVAGDRDVKTTTTALGRTVWEGVVKVFDLIGHPTANRLYAWSHDTDDPASPRRHVTVLHAEAVTSPILAVRAAIIQEFRNNATAEA